MKTKLIEETIPASTPSGRATVRLQYQAPEAKSVYVAGTFNDWRCDLTPLLAVKAGLWAVELELPPGDYEYRFVVDGYWFSDRGASETAPNPFGSHNSVLRVP